VNAVQKRQRDKNTLRQDIMDAARDLFVAEGYENVSMRKIADRIEYSPTAIYLHFKDKSELLKSICTATFEGLASALEGVSAKFRTGKYDPVELLKKGLRIYVEFGLAHPNHYQLTFLSPYEDSRPEDPICMQAFEYLVEGVQACIAEGRFRAQPPEEISQALWAAIHGVTSLLIQHSGFPFVARKKLINCVIDSMVAGLEA
jgi:AcrR family transcriptional regulator